MGSIKKHKKSESCIDNIIFETIVGEEAGRFFSPPYSPVVSQYDNNSAFKIDVDKCFKEADFFFMRNETYDFQGPEKM